MNYSQLLRVTLVVCATALAACSSFAPNTLALMVGKAPFGNFEIGGMFTVVKVRDDIKLGDYSDPGWFNNPPKTVAAKISSDPNFGNPPRIKS